MKKEYIIGTIGVLLFLSYGIDYISGNVNLPIKNPYDFVSPMVLGRYPLTAVGVALRGLGLGLTVWFLVSVFEKKYFFKLVLLLVIGLISQLYAVQQLATGMRTTTVQWTLSLAYGGLFLILPAVIFLIKGVVDFFVEDVDKI